MEKQSTKLRILLWSQILMETKMDQKIRGITNKIISKIRAFRVIKIILKFERAI